MAIYHCSVKNISRSGGKSAVASASYRAGEKLEDRETGLTHDYTNKSEVAYSEIFLCENAPREYQDRETLWNAVEEVEKQSNARLAREWEVALPNELTLEQGKELVRGYAQSLADEGMCVDANIHWKDGNHHAHIMGTTRPIKENGEWGQKEKKAYKLDENGQKIPQIDPKTGEQKIGARGRKMWQRETVEANDWNRSEKVEEWRERWADHCNKALEQAQSLERVGHRSFERQGIERIAESKAQEADKLKSHLEAVEADLSGQIDKKALNLVESKLNALQGVYEAKQRSLDSEYKALTVSHEGFLFGCLLYGILVTVFTAIRSKAFTGDFKTFFITVGNFFMWCGKSLYWLGIQASKLGDMIPQPIVATIVHWLLFIIACFGVAIVLVILAFTGIYAWFEWFKENQADLASLSVFLVSLALIIFFADVFKAFLPVNLLLLLLLVQIIAMLARVGYKQYRKYY